MLSESNPTREITNLANREIIGTVTEGLGTKPASSRKKEDPIN